MRPLSIPAKVALAGGVSAVLLGTGAAVAVAHDGRSEQDSRHAELADALGVDAATMEQALQDMRKKKSAEHRNELASRLDQAVSAGTISESDKESVLKAFDAGVLDPGPRGGGREGGPREGASRDDASPEAGERR